MTTIRLVVGAVLLLSLSSCLMEGAACQPEGGGVCEEGKPSALFCENGTFQRYACPGPMGCSTNAQTKAIFCDFRGTAIGEFCPVAAVSSPDAGPAQTTGFCSSPTGFARCFSDTRRWSAIPCSSCTTTGISSTCTP